MSGPSCKDRIGLATRPATGSWTVSSLVATGTTYWEDPSKPGVRTVVQSGTAELDLAPGERRALAVTIRGEETVIVPALSVRVNDHSGIGNAEVLAMVSNVGSAPVRSFVLRLYHSVEGGAYSLVQEQVVTGLIKPGDFGQARFKVAALAGGVLPAGEYAARLAVGAITDRASNSLGREMVLRFAVTPGDANGDGVTNERDYPLVWRELRKSEATRSLRADALQIQPGGSRREWGADRG